MNLTIISDIHVARVWDKVDDVVPKEHDFLNPNRHFRDLASKLDEKTTLVINGDLVDYFYDSYHHKKGPENWSLFFEILSIFKGEKLLNVGNHDHRKIAYNFNIASLKHVNIDRKTFKKHSHEIGFKRFRLFKELDSIMVNTRRFNPFPKEIEERERARTVDDHRLVFLNTGPDSLIKPRIALNPLNWPFVFSGYLSSDGLAKNEIELLEKEMRERKEKDFLIFLHCPPFFSKKNIPEIKLKKATYPSLLKKFGLSYITFSKNNWRFIENLLNSEKNITVVTSHSHIAKQYIIDKEEKTLKESSIEEINKLRNNPRYVKFVSTLPLGAIRPANDVGYMTVTSEKIEYTVLKSYNMF